VKMLLDRGANLNVLDVGGKTALHMAARKANIEIVKVCYSSLIYIYYTNKYNNISVNIFIMTTLTLFAKYKKFM